MMYMNNHLYRAPQCTWVENRKERKKTYTNTHKHHNTIPPTHNSLKIVLVMCLTTRSGHADECAEGVTLWRCEPLGYWQAEAAGCLSPPQGLPLLPGGSPPASYPWRPVIDSLTDGHAGVSDSWLMAVCTVFSFPDYSKWREYCIV